MPATLRIGTCSWADDGLIRSWYPRGVSSAEKRLRYYAERFDTVEVDSPFYALPAPDVTGRWAQRTHDGFVFHVKASGEMTHHRPAQQEQAFAAFRSALEPLELSGKLRGVLLQYHPSFVRSRAALNELERVRALLSPLVPLVEFRHRSWLEPDVRAETLGFLERHGLSYVSVDAPPTRAANVMPPVAAVTGPVAYVRFHGRNARTWNIRAEKSWQRFDWMYEPSELAEWVPKVADLAREADQAYALFNNNKDDFAPRSAGIFRRLPGRRGNRRDGRARAPARATDALLSADPGSWQPPASAGVPVRPTET